MRKWGSKLFWTAPRPAAGPAVAPKAGEEMFPAHLMAFTDSSVTVGDLHPVAAEAPLLTPGAFDVPPVIAAGMP